MEQAVFSIIDYRFDKVYLDFTNYQNTELNLSFEPKGIYFNETKTFELIFDVQITHDLEAEPFVQIRCKGLFKLENIESFEEIPSFFYSNCIAILFPYVRAYLSLITTQANARGIILPTMNLSNLEGDLRKNTIQM